MTQEVVSVYEGEKITVTYDRRRCIHAAECGRSGSPVFDIIKDPWVDPNLADVESVVRIIHRCPTAALTYQRKDGGSAESAPERNTITVSPNGPLYVRGQVQIVRPDGTEISREYRVALCRCGASKHKPICDNSHLETGFKDLGPINADPDPAQTLEAGALKITVRKDGPLHVEGPVTVYAGNGREAMRATEIWLCRCGGSQNKPFCDGTHKKIGFRPDSGAAG
jgi:CDGSH-type Zn-finger protein/uncharacterized Fe-S cluster protein YjdI